MNTIRQQVEDMVPRGVVIDFSIGDSLFKGKIDGASQHGFWVVPFGLSYVSYEDVTQIKESPDQDDG